MLIHLLLSVELDTGSPRKLIQCPLRHAETDDSTKFLVSNSLSEVDN